MITVTHLTRESKIWLKRRSDQVMIVQIIPDSQSKNIIPNYALFEAFDEQPEYLGCILFDSNGYWIYDGAHLSVTEQEQVAQFILRGK
ncbi:hypothetical protein [Mucilaginibacter terrae]|nr:hypothetical protein [Mucilaginibacter terrae]